MRSHPALFVALTTLALVAAADDPLRAEERPSRSAPADDEFERALAALGPTPTTDDVLRIATRAASAAEMPALRFTGAMASHGGHACAAGLRAMVRHPEPGVRAAALRGIAETRLRVSRGMDAVRDAVNDPAPAVRDAAYAAIGVVGDARDVPPLLDALTSQDGEVVAAAFAALRELSGARLRCRAPLWNQWWKESESAAPERLFRALADFESDAASSDEARVVVERNAWVRLREVRDRVATNLRAENETRRRAAYRLVGALRLGDLAGPLASALSTEMNEDCARAGLESAKALGAAVRRAPTIR